MQGDDVASSASASATSFPEMPTWPGIQNSFSLLECLMHKFLISEIIGEFCKGFLTASIVDLLSVQTTNFPREFSAYFKAWSMAIASAVNAHTWFCKSPLQTTDFSAFTTAKATPELFFEPSDHRAIQFSCLSLYSFSFANLFLYDQCLLGCRKQHNAILFSLFYSFFLF